MQTIDNSQLSSLSPSSLWEHFRRLTLIPRPSGHEKAVIDYIAEVARAHNYEAQRDDAGNIIVRAAATPGFEHLKPVVLQAHADMVSQKEPSVEHDFLTDPIKVRLDNGWVSACGTTLGADDGIGVAAALTALTDKTVQHGPLEVLITIGEEVNFVGAFALKPNVLDGSILINLDAEQEGEVVMAGDGGVHLYAAFHGSRVATAPSDAALCVSLSGLSGGHSGIDIKLGRANANKLMARFLKFAAATYESMLADFEGGNIINAIPRDAKAVVTIDADDVDGFLEAVDEFEDLFRSEYADTDPQLHFSASRVELPTTVLDEMTTDDLINALQGVPDGIVRMMPSMPDVVETSSNLSFVKMENDAVSVKVFIRSFSESQKEDAASSAESIFRLAGAEVETLNRYPSWKPNPSSEILKTVVASYLQQFGREPIVKAFNAGLECGMIAETYPLMDIVSIGPTVRYPHSPAEKIEIASVERFWTLLTAILKSIPSQNK